MISLEDVFEVVDVGVVIDKWISYCVFVVVIKG